MVEKIMAEVVGGVDYCSVPEILHFHKIMKDPILEALILGIIAGSGHSSMGRA